VEGRLAPEIELALCRASAVVSVSLPAARKIKALGYRHVRVIHNMVDETRFLARPFPAGIFRFFSMGGLVRHKGFDILLRAIAQWSPPVGEVEFVMAGDGAERQALQAMAQDLGIAGHVRWVGAISREQAPGYFRDCHAFVLASRRESFGVVFAEAIASGRPIIATRCGGPEDIVNPLNGSLILPESASQLAAALEEMKRNHARYNPVTIREDFMRRFSRPAITAQIRQMYSEVAGRN
jgi:glycosyltransferase involved in cell wall biosynthesis